MPCLLLGHNTRHHEKAVRSLKRMTKAEKLCSGVRADIKDQVVTLADATFAMQEKIKQKIPEYKRMELCQEVTIGKTGKTVLRQNPAIQEFRATVKDYASTLNSLNNILSDNKAPTQISDVAELRKKYKIAK